MMKAFYRGALAASLLMAGFAAVSISSGDAAETKKTVPGTAVITGATKAPDTRIKGGLTGTVGTTTGGTVVNLTTSDCKLLLGGTVVQVFDGRCGSSGAYCKSSSGSACISEK